MKKTEDINIVTDEEMKWGRWLEVETSEGRIGGNIKSLMSKWHIDHDTTFNSYFYKLTNFLTTIDDEKYLWIQFEILSISEFWYMSHMHYGHRQQ